MARIEAAIQRIDNARIDNARTAPPTSPDTQTGDNGSSAKVMALVNAHEKLREEVADTMRELDDLIEDLEA